MNDVFIQTPNRYNLVTWYLLPLTTHNTESFNVSNFINCYLSTRDMILLVEVADLNLCRDSDGKCRFDHFLGEHIEGDREFIVLRIPERFDSDVELFRAGRYSEFSDLAKYNIRAYSGLKYNVKDSKGNLITDAILMALKKHPGLKRKWEEELGLPGHILTDDCELLSRPSPSSFMDFQNPFPIPPEPNPVAEREWRYQHFIEIFNSMAKRRREFWNGFSNNSLSFDNGQSLEKRGS
ncbi:hypothetical protein [Asinibacterium sp. OR53]|uniref:hypothetical protein n=1 Tax=Asinibacterium sp. OR53 TaxID=925409 RepID=UPI0004B0996B|nr:hypothetical protein [Asinibacterium sp. OR53]